MKKTESIFSSHRNQNGFTLIELMVTITIVAILASIAAPSMRDFIRNGRLTAAANDLLRSYQVARTEAIKRQQNVIVCATTTPGNANAACSSGGTFSTGWLVFEDTDQDAQRSNTEQLIESHPALDNDVTVTTDNASLTGFSSAGILVPGLVSTLAITICDDRHNTQVGTNSTARALFITTPTGRTRVSKTYTDVSMSVSC